MTINQCLPTKDESINFQELLKANKQIINAYKRGQSPSGKNIKRLIKAIGVK